jgi:hypothetical protein
MQVSNHRSATKDTDTPERALHTRYRRHLVLPTKLDLDDMPLICACAICGNDVATLDLKKLDAELVAEGIGPASHDEVMAQREPVPGGCVEGQEDHRRARHRDEVSTSPGDANRLLDVVHRVGADLARRPAVVSPQHVTEPFLCNAHV